MPTAADAVAQARRILQDYDEDRYDAATLLGYYNSARRALQVAQPHLYSVEQSVTTVAGSRQSLPSDCSVFYEVTRNADGGPVTIVEREFLDSFMPAWRNKTAGPAKHFCYDERSRLQFDLYPPALAGAQVFVSFSKVPADVDADDPLTGQEAPYFDALADYVVGRCLLEDAESPVNQRRAVTHFQAFAGATGSNLAQVLANSPNNFNRGGAPARIQSQE